MKRCNLARPVAMILVLILAAVLLRPLDISSWLVVSDKEIAANLRLMAMHSKEALFDRNGFFQEREDLAAWVSSFVPQYVVTDAGGTEGSIQWQPTFSDGAHLSLLRVFRIPHSMVLHQVAFYLQKVGLGGTYVVNILNAQNQTQTYATIDPRNVEEGWLRLDLATEAGHFGDVEREAVLYVVIGNLSRIDSNNQLLFGCEGKPRASYVSRSDCKWTRMIGELATKLCSLPESRGFLGTLSTSYVLGEFLIPQYLKEHDPNLVSVITKSADWLMTMQNSTPTSTRHLLFHDGEDMISGRKVPTSSILAVTQAIIALARTYEVTNERKYLNASVMAAGALQRSFLNHTTGAVYLNMNEHETFEVYGDHSKKIVEPYGGRAISAMMVLYRLTGSHTYLQSAISISDFFIRAQNSDGSWYAIMDDEGKPNTWFGSEPYVSSYVLEGLLDLYSVIGVETYRQAFSRGCGWLTSNLQNGKGAPDHVILGTGHRSTQIHSFGSFRVAYLCYLIYQHLGDVTMGNIGNNLIRYLSRTQIRTTISEYLNQTVTMSGNSFIANNWSIHYDSASDEPDNSVYRWFELTPLVLSVKLAWTFEALEMPLLLTTCFLEAANSSDTYRPSEVIDQLNHSSYSFASFRNDDCSTKHKGLVLPRLR